MDLYELLMADEPSAESRAKALGQALGVKEQAGLLGQLSGDRVLSGVGGSLMQSAQTGNQRLGDVLRQRQAKAAAQAAAAQEAAQFQARQGLEREKMAADQGYRQQQIGFQGREINLRERQADQEAWAAVPDQTGGVVMFNKKTGEYRPLGPQGTGRPGAGTGLKPAQFEADVQSLGKDVEPISKAAPDIERLRTVTAAKDVAGFGPVAGRVPNLLVSEEGVQNRQAAGRLMAAIIQATSGQAASEKEVDRLLEANGMGRTATTEQLRLGVQKLGEQYQNLLKQREAKYMPEVVDTYGQRGGYTSKTVAPASADGSVKVTTVEEARALPPGTRFVDPNGVERVR